MSDPTTTGGVLGGIDPADLDAAPLALVVPIGKDRFALIAGAAAHARARLSGYARQRALVGPELSAVERSIARRHDLAATAGALRSRVWLAARLSALGLPGVQASEVLGTDAGEFSRLVRVSEAAPGLQQRLFSGRLTLGHARPLLTLPHADQARLTEMASARAWSVNTVIKEAKAVAMASRTRLYRDLPLESDYARTRDPDVLAHEREIGAQLGAATRITQPPLDPRSGVLCIDYYSIEELKGILGRLAAGEAESPATAAKRTSQPRVLRIAFSDPDELAMLTSGLLATPLQKSTHGEP